jgi:hypothetical protein
MSMLVDGFDQSDLHKLVVLTWNIKWHSGIGGFLPWDIKHGVPIHSTRAK